MHMIHFHVILSLTLITLAFGAIVLILAKAYPKVDTLLPRLIGYLIIIISLLSLMCMGSLVIKCLHDKAYCTMMQKQMMQRPMTHKMHKHLTLNNVKTL